MQIANPKYADQTGAFIDVDFTFDEATANQYHAAGETIRYTYHPGDTWPVNLAIGEWLAQGGHTIAAYVAPPARVPSAVTRRQMLIALAQAGLITTAEAIAAAQSGTPPAVVQSVIDTLPTDAAKTAAKITWAAMSVAERDNPLVAALAAAVGMDSAAIDAFFINAATL